jgi:hypothetical protein
VIEYYHRGYDYDDQDSPDEYTRVNREDNVALEEVIVIILTNTDLSEEMEAIENKLLYTLMK